MSTPTKVCTQCKVSKELNALNFYKHKLNKSGFHSWCKPCVLASNKAFDNRDVATKKWRSERVMRSRNKSAESKARHAAHADKWRSANYARVRDTMTAKRLGVPKGWLLAQLERTKGMCDICGVEHLTAEHPRFIFVDHCHDTGKARGLLCANCNFGIGHFKNSPSLLLKAAAYLKKHSEKS